MSKNYCSTLPKETLIYNIQYHLLNHCETKEECIERIKTLIENFEDKNNNDREN